MLLSVLFNHNRPVGKWPGSLVIDCQVDTVAGENINHQGTSAVCESDSTELQCAGWSSVRLFIATAL